ncbi:hypothetical protein QFC24_006061 [Naganishia onofrii]|uniref:Uncharacterized protein n=1 Tax=Naganishia onofrii TaxID=1851511 RepID=A0ACC2X7X5_9TREE|nr:hypothetical protein QFC24_006061 [Naganishia onofrii]
MDSSEDDSQHPHPSQLTSADTATGTIVPAGTPPAPDDGPPRSNWICVICGYLGCSRYARGHARDHYARTGHAYSMEIDTQRVWDYVEDSYVHRLIQNRSDGKLVELPSAASFVSSRINHHLSALSLVDKHLGFGPSVSDEKKISKLEDMTLEYSYLLSTQLEQQKQHYEVEIGMLKREVKEWRSKVGEGDSWRKRFVVEEEKRRAVEERKMPELERAKVMSEKKAQIATDLAKSLQADLRSERALSSGLLDKIKSLETQLATAVVTVAERTGQLKEAEEMVRDLMVSISAAETLAEAFLADENARKRRRDEPVGIAPSPPKEPQAGQPNGETSNTATEDTQEVPSSRRPRRYTPYGPLPIRPGETVAEQIDAIQQQHHEIASHAYFLTDKALRGTATDVVDPVGIWGFERSMVERFPSLKKRNFFCIQHHQATGEYAVLLHSTMYTLVFGRLPINVYMHNSATL